MHFRKYVDLRECKFFRKTDFYNSTFEDNVYFNDCFFESKIDLQNTIFYKNVNYLNIKVNDGVENRETARIIKDSFEQQNNIML
ncbi:pentapeptide repeat-containing protein [Arcobacter sp.]|uniref:pentapeptide repeat-containing protein n=1 Tax=unclassified Arcobacter TaxID=2593671 RepID=UPI003AFF6C04